MSDTTTIPTWTLADRLAKARDHAGVSQAEMADYLGMAQTTISKYEHGAPPRVGTLRLWALRCGVSLDWLATGTDPKALLGADITDNPGYVDNDHETQSYRELAA